MRYAIIATVLAIPMLMGAGGSCDGVNVPSMAQIELNVPASIRSCPRAPVSPGANSTPKQRAQYVLALYNAWEVCGGNLKQVNVLITRWEREVAKHQGQ